jgi:hypothetical protein
MKHLKQDTRGIVVNIGLGLIAGLILCALALIGWGLHSTILWDYSWAFVALGTAFLTGKLLGMNLWGLLILPAVVAVLWWAVVMGGL